MMALLRSSFGSAVLGGLIVAALGAIAIAAGWVEADAEGGPTAPAMVPTAPAAAQADGAKTVNEIYEEAGPGVVHIEAERSTPAPSPAPFGPPPDRGGSATGSGFVFDDEGRIVTNAHVVAGADRVEVTLEENGEEYEAEVLGSDSSTDVAVLEIDAPAEELHPIARGDSGKLSVGDPVVAIGNPFGLDRTVTTGIVSALSREIQAPNGFVIRDAIQTDASINPGNSGGPLLDGRGRVIGVNSQIHSSSGGNDGIGFAVPINTAAEIAQQLIDDGEVQHAFLGLSGADLTGDLRDVLNIEVEGGAVVQSVVPRSPADEAGIEAGDTEVTIDGNPYRVGGDVIVAVEGEAIDSMSDVIAAVDERAPGDELELTLLRGGERRQVTVKLAERPEGGGR